MTSTTKKPAYFGLAKSVILLVIILAAGACGGSDDPPDAGPIDAPPPGGSISIRWSLSDGTNTITCEDIGAFSVVVQVVPSEGGSGDTDVFSCGTGEGTTKEFAPGTYNVRIDLTDGQARSLLAMQLRVNQQSVVSAEDLDLGEQSFEVELKGGFEFTIDSSAISGNCDDMGTDGGYINEVEFELRDSEGACLPATFEVAAGAEGEAGTYVTNCTPMRFGCIENDQIVSVVSTISGPHTLAINAYVDGGLQCYEEVAQFVVPGNNLIAEIPAIPLDFFQEAGCDPTFSVPDGGTADAASADAGVDASM